MTAPISSPRCDAWRPAVDSDRDQPEINGPATEVRCRFAAGHPGQHAAYGITWDAPVTAPTPAGQARVDRGEADLIERVARWMFERSTVWSTLCSPERADWDEWVERNRDEWRDEAAAAIEVLRGETR